MRGFQCSKAWFKRHSSANTSSIGVGICACRKKKHVGWYCSKIYTKHDTTYDEITLQGVADTLEAVLRQVVGKEQA